ncbi:uncharacterized protein V1510DRAFT_365477 [Dipodascopsis tothii]|uniref:uncharacterized protein n=1 Tax=Dipodascopsis tothii TaxID=44089 RepID=UPI0034CFE33A
MQRLLKSKGHGGIIQLTGKTFDPVVDAPRDYDVMVLLTAAGPEMNCQLCKQFQPSYDLLAASWAGDHAGGDGLFFAQLDFKDGQNVFQRLGLNSVPNLWVYRAGKDEPVKYDFAPTADLTQATIKFIADTTGRQVVLRQPRDYSKIFSVASTVFALAVGVKIFLPVIRNVVQSKVIWMGLAMVAILLFISGHMFNNIRHTPYVSGDRSGQVQYIARTFQMQYGFETQLVAIIYAILAFGTISLATKVPRTKSKTKQTTAVTVWTVLLFVAFSLLLFVFRMKNGGYPFSLPPFSKV